MRRLFHAFAAVSASLLAATAAQSATTIITPSIQPPGTSFLVAGNIFSGPIAASFGHTGIVAGAFTDLFQFTIPQNGVGSGSVITGTDAFLSTTDLDITSVTVNGLAALLVLRDSGGNVCFVRGGVTGCGATEGYSIAGVPITSLALNTINVTGTSRGLGSFGGNATFSPVPEPATWAMMLIGFGAMGVAFRRRRVSALKIA